MNKFLILAVACLILTAGCSDVTPGQSSKDTTVTAGTPKTPEEQARQAQLLAPMDEIAKRTMGGDGKWTSLPQADRQPFLDFHGGSEEKAAPHYEGMVEQHKEMAARS